MTMRACLLSLLVLAGVLSAAGCSDVESCLEEKTPGCLNSAVRTQAPECLFDLVAVDGICRKSGTSSTPSDCPEECAAGSVCDASSKRCIDFCTMPDRLPGSVLPPEPIFCEAIATSQMPSPPMLEFAEVCRRRCRLNCQRLSQFCPGYQCPAGACDTQDVQNKCASDCPAPAAGGNDLACLTRLCNNIRLARCDSAASCPNGGVPNCSGLTCSNDCMFGSTSVAADGVCDDGEVYTSSTAQCGWGSDCTDCGPRNTPKIPAGNIGDVCQYSLNCAGGTGLPNTAGAWCVNQMAFPGVARCMANCSRGEACPNGFECIELYIEKEDGSSDVITVDGFRSAACVPKACR